MASISFSIQDTRLGVSALVTLTEYLDPVSNQAGVIINVSLDTLAFGSIEGIFFDLVDDNTSGLGIVSNQTLGNGTLLNTVTTSAFSQFGDNINNIGSASIQGSSQDGGFDTAVAIIPTISGGGSTATFFVSGASLADFVGEEFGVRLKSNNGGSNQSGKLTGIVGEGTFGEISVRSEFVSNDILFEKLVDIDGVDSNGDGKLEFVPKYYLAPERGATVLQEVTVDNAAGVSASNTQIKISATSPFLELTGIDYTGDGIADPSGNGFTITKTVDQDGTQTFLVTISQLAARSSVTFNAISQVTARGDTSLNCEFDLDFQLRDTTTGATYSTKDDGSIYLSKTGYGKAAGQSIFSFAELTDYSIDFDLFADGTTDDRLSAQPVRGAGTLVNNQTNAEVEYILLSLDGDVDARLSGSYRNLNSGLVTSADLDLVWYNSPAQVSSSTYQNFVSGTGADTYDELETLIRDGLYGESLAAESTPKNGSGSFRGTSYNPDGSVNQTVHLKALSGNITGSGNPINYLIIDFPLAPPNTGLSLQQVLQNFGTLFPSWDDQDANGNDLYDQIIFNFTTTQSVQLSNYTSALPWFDKITGFILPSTSPLTIQNAFAQETLDLSNISCLDSQGNITGVTVVSSGANSGTKNKDTVMGTTGPDTLTGDDNGDDILNGKAGNDSINGANGKDIVIGGLGNDTVKGGQAQDIFVVAAGQGTDIFIDFTRNQDSVGLANGLRASDLSFANGRLTRGTEVLAVFNSNSGVTNISQISFQTYSSPI